MNRGKVGRRLVIVLTLIVLAIGLLGVGSAFAQQEPYGGGNPPGPPGQLPPGPPEETGPRGGLAFTGADVTLFVVVGLALVVTGLVIVRRSRERPAIA